jgi:hypothetical protein
MRAAQTHKKDTTRPNWRHHARDLRLKGRRAQATASKKRAEGCRLRLCSKLLHSTTSGGALFLGLERVGSSDCAVGGLVTLLPFLQVGQVSLFCDGSARTPVKHCCARPSGSARFNARVEGPMPPARLSPSYPPRRCASRAHGTGRTVPCHIDGFNSRRCAHSRLSHGRPPGAVRRGGGNERPVELVNSTGGAVRTARSGAKPVPLALISSRAASPMARTDKHSVSPR